MATSTFEEDLRQLLRARFPVLYIETWEEDRAIESIVSVAQNEELVRTARAVYSWSSTSGFAPHGESDVRTQDARQALSAARAMNEPCVLVFKDLHNSFGSNGGKPDEVVIRHLRDIAQAFRHSEHPSTLILLSPVVLIPSELEKVVTLLEFPLPDEKEISTLVNEMISSNQSAGRIEVSLAREEQERLTKAAVGLTLAEAENALARAMVNEGRLDVSDVQVILDEKRRTIRKSGILDVVPMPGRLTDVAGLDNLKRWLNRRAGSWLEAAHEYGLPAPKGVMITGVPGCGKSLTAKAIAGEWQLPLLRLDMGRVFAGLVGSSEQNMRTAIRIAEAIAPCVLWIDEIEKGFSGLDSSGDTGVSKRVFGTFLTWMQEKEASVFVVATANNIDGLPPEFLRKGRFDEIFFVDLPTVSERAQIWKLHLDRRLKAAKAARGSITADDTTAMRLAELAEGFSGAEIEQCVIAALYEAFADRRTLTFEDVARAIEYTVPLAVTQAEPIIKVRQWAATRAVSATSIDHKPSFEDQVDTLVAPKPPDVNSWRGGRKVDY